MQVPDLTAALRQAKAIGCEIDLKHAIFFSARDAVVANPAHNVAGRARLLLPLTVPATASLARPAAYELSFVGSQRQTIMTEDRAAHLDLRTLKGRSHLYGIGPIEGLTGEVTIADSRPSLARVGADQLVHATESYEAGVPFFVWAEVSVWQTQELPELRTYAELEKLVGEAGAKAGLTQAFPFVMTGRPKLIDFHIVNATPDTKAHKKIQIPFELHSQDATFVGFWSSQHQGIFTPMGTNMHVHFQTLDNKI